MSLDNIRLPAFVIQDLFQKTLVDLNTEKKQGVARTGGLDFFGGNKQHVVLIVNNPDSAFVTDEQLTFLSGILAACKLTLDDIGLINIATDPSITYKMVTECLSPRIVMLFGITPAAISLPFVMPVFQGQSFQNAVYVAVPPLRELEKDQDLKRKLWTVLQQLFSL